MFAVLLRRSRTIVPSTGVKAACLSYRPIFLRPGATSRVQIASFTMAATKRKQSAAAIPADATANGDAPPPKRRASARKPPAVVVNPDTSKDIIDAPDAMRASPDNGPNEDFIPGPIKVEERKKSESPLSDAPDVVEPPKLKRGRGKKAEAEKNIREAESVVAAVVDAAESKAPAKRGRAKKNEVKAEEDADDASVAATTPAKTSKKTSNESGDLEGEEEIEAADPEELKSAAFRPPAVNSSYLPLPWTGRLGYACLNTYLRTSNPPIFSSRTCRIQSILEHRHPLEHPDQPEHPTKNRPDRSKPADVELGRRYLESVCLANVKDVSKMVRWNEKYNIRFMRLSSEMFPFASHAEYGYGLAPFASEALAEAGKVIAELNHRVTTHPGQFTQLGSPRQPVIENAIRDLVYHDEMLSLLKLPEQQNKDAVMILHMGGVFEGKAETIARFKENYVKLSDSVKNRLVLENDDVCYTVHDLLPVCEELNIPMVLDYHHHNILFDSDKIREGTADIVDLYPRIFATWERKGITPKFHYSEQTPPAITGKQRRKHNPRPWTLPPCPPNSDLMIEAKDKEQAVFELMRTFKLPGFDRIADIIPYERFDDNKEAESAAGQRKIAKGEHFDLVPEEEIGMGGPQGRVYWPPGMEEWLRPKKREVKQKKEDTAEKEAKKKEKLKKEAEKLYAERQAALNGKSSVVKEEEEEDSDADATPATKKAKAAMKKADAVRAAKAAAKVAQVAAKEAAADGKKKTTPAKQGGGRKKASEAVQPTPSASDEEEEDVDLDAEDSEDDEPVTPAKRPAAKRQSGRAVRAKVSYAEADAGGDDEDMDMK